MWTGCTEVWQRVQRKLLDFGEVRGLVFGAFGEASEGVHGLVHHLANSRLKAEGLQQGRESGKGELGVLVGQVICSALQQSGLRLSAS